MKPKIYVCISSPKNNSIIKTYIMVNIYYAYEILRCIIKFSKLEGKLWCCIYLCHEEYGNVLCIVEKTLLVGYIQSSEIWRFFTTNLLWYWIQVFQDCKPRKFKIMEWDLQPCRRPVLTKVFSQKRFRAN